jgi:hypothetical protein
LKLIDKYFFKPTLPYKYMFLLKCEKDEKPQVHFRHSLINFKNSNIPCTYNLHKGYKVDYDICLNFHQST